MHISRLNLASERFFVQKLLFFPHRSWFAEFELIRTRQLYLVLRFCLPIKFSPTLATVVYSASLDAQFPAFDTYILAAIPTHFGAGRSEKSAMLVTSCMIDFLALHHVRPCYYSIR
jgi:hypothetical protein